MAREITGVREQLVSINSCYPDKELLTKKDIFKYLGISRNTLKKRFPELWSSEYTAKTELARILARYS